MLASLTGMKIVLMRKWLPEEGMLFLSLFYSILFYTDFLTPSSRQVILYLVFKSPLNLRLPQIHTGLSRLRTWDWLEGNWPTFGRIYDLTALDPECLPWYQI